MQKKEFIERVSSLIKYKNVCSKIEEELDCHVEDLKKEYKDDETTKNASDEKLIEERVINQMGDANTIAKEFNNVYKPKYDWIFNAVSILLLSGGCLVGNSLITLGLLPSISLGQFALLCVAIIIGIGFNFINYRNIQNYSWPLFFSTFVITVCSKFCNVICDYYILIIASYILSCSGLLRKYGLKKNTIIPAFISIASVMLLGNINVIILSIAYLSIAIFQKEIKINKKIVFAITCSVFFILCVMIILSTNFNRIQIYNNPKKYADNEGYIYIMKGELLRKSKFIGNADLKIEELIGELSSDNVFTYIITRFGILFALILVLMYSIFIYRLIINANKIGDKYGKGIFIGLSIIFVIQILLNILNGLNLIPYISIKLPFITMDSPNIVSNIIILSVLISIYRRKNLII